MIETKRCKAYRFVCAYCHGLKFVDTYIFDEYANDSDYEFLGIFEFEIDFLDRLDEDERGVWDETGEG